MTEFRSGARERAEAHPPPRAERTDRPCAQHRRLPRPGRAALRGGGHPTPRGSRRATHKHPPPPAGIPTGGRSEAHADDRTKAWSPLARRREDLRPVPDSQLILFSRCRRARQKNARTPQGPTPAAAARAPAAPAKDAPRARAARRGGLETSLEYRYFQAKLGNAICVQSLDDSLNSAIHITYHISLRSSSLR